MGHFWFGHFDPARGRHVRGPENWGCRMPRSIELVQIIYTQYIYIYMYILRTTKGCGISNFGYSHVMGAFHLRAYALKKL